MRLYWSSCVVCSAAQSRPPLCDPLWTVAEHASLSVEFFKQENSSRLPFPAPGNLPNPGIEPTSVSPALTGGFFTTLPTGQPCIEVEHALNTIWWILLADETRRQTYADSVRTQGGSRVMRVPRLRCGCRDWDAGAETEMRVPRLWCRCRDCDAGAETEMQPQARNCQQLLDFRRKALSLSPQE